MRKGISLLLVALLLSAGSLVATAQEPVTVQFWHSRSGVHEQIVTHAVDSFNETIGRDEGIVVEATYVGSYDKILEETRKAMAAGQSPQVIVVVNNQVGPMIDEGSVIDMAAFAQASGFDTGNLMAPFLQIYGNTDGALHSVPYVRSVPLLYYNKGLADAKGLTPSNDLNGGFQAFCEGLSAQNADGTTAVHGFQVLNDFGYYQTANLYQLGSASVAADGKSSPALADGSMARVLGEWRAWVDAGWCRPFDTKSAASTMRKLFCQGTLGSFTSSSGSMKGVLAEAAEAGVEVDVLPYMTYGAPLSQIGGANLCIVGPGNSEAVQRASWAFVEYLMSDDMVAYNAMESGYLPVTRSVADYAPLQAFWAENPLYRVAYDQLATARCQELPYTAVTWQFDKLCQDVMVELIAERSIDVDEALTRIAALSGDLFAQ